MVSRTARQKTCSVPASRESGSLGLYSESRCFSPFLSCSEVPYPHGLIPLVPKPSTAFNEDCLYLNLGLPRGCKKEGGFERGNDYYYENEADDVKGLAVLVWIHGGAFEWGTGSTTPTYYTARSSQQPNASSMNYRLGPLGFLSLGSEHAPGNLGLLDQVLALTWIRDNAGNVSGSRVRITMFGESAGALSTAVHMMYPLSRNLFSRAILMSGTPIARWEQRAPQQHAHNTHKLAQYVGCDNEDEKMIMKCLQNVDTLDLGILTLNLRFKNPSFGMMVGGYVLQEPIPDYFISSPKVKPIPFMIGVTKDDGSFIYSLAAVEDIVTRPSNPHVHR